MRETRLIDLRTGREPEPHEWMDARRGLFWRIRRLLGFPIRTNRKERRRQQDRKEEP